MAMSGPGSCSSWPAGWWKASSALESLFNISQDASSTAPQGALAKETRQRLAAIPVRFVPQPTLCRGIAWQKDFEQVPRREEASVTEAMADRQPAVEPRAPVLLAINDE